MLNGNDDFYSVCNLPLLGLPPNVVFGVIEITGALQTGSKTSFGSSHCGLAETNLSGIHEDTHSIPSLAQWVHYHVGHRHSLDLASLWLWCRPAATAQIGSLAWELPYATGAALKKKSWSSCCGAVEMNPTRNHEVAGLMTGLRTQHCHELWCRSQTRLGPCVAVAVV